MNNKIKFYLYFFICVIIVTVAPYSCTRSACWDSLDFSETGSIGDTIGGITAPIIGLISIFLLYRTLQEQVRINLEQKKFNDATRILSMETFISQMANNISFGYSTNRGIEEARGLGDLQILNRELNPGVGIAEGEFSKLFESIRTLNNNLNLYYDFVMSKDILLENTQRSFVSANLLSYYGKVADFYNMILSSNIEIYYLHQNTETKPNEPYLSNTNNLLADVLTKIEGLR